jgi:hypothetical protein
VQQVWYVAYGSNLSRNRFRCYVAGGQPAGGNRDYPGCRDPSEPERVESLEVPGALFFAGRSGVWGGGMAFYNGRGSGRVACRGYLVTADQFADVAAQEMRRPPGGEFARDLAGLLPDVESVHTMGPGRYETVTRLGVLDGVPLFTVTHADVGDLDPAAPTAPYLQWIATGLREAHGWSGERIGAYLAAAPGALGAWTAEEITALAETAGATGG